MALFGKSEQERLTDTFDYLAEMRAPQNKINELFDWVYVDGPFQAATISNALSLGFGTFSRHGTTKDSRRAIRACILARLAVETPRSPSASATTWKTTYQSMQEMALRTEILKYLGRLNAPVVVQPMTPVGVKPVSYGVSLQDLQQARGALKTPTPVVRPTPLPQSPGVSSTTQQKKDFFETVSRLHVILSGHGSWLFDGGSNDWPRVMLGPQQILRCYCRHFYPLGNDAGQLVDNRRFPAPMETFGPGGDIPNYTLHHKDKLVLLNKGGGNADQEFITVDHNTLLSDFLRNPKYSAATFHWAACRVVFNDQGKVACPTHNTWEEFNAACVLH